MCHVPAALQHRWHHLEHQGDRAKFLRCGRAVLIPADTVRITPRPVRRQSATTRIYSCRATARRVRVRRGSQDEGHALHESGPGWRAPAVHVSLRHGEPFCEERVPRHAACGALTTLAGFHGTLFQPRSSTSKKMMWGLLPAPAAAVALAAV